MDIEALSEQVEAVSAGYAAAFGIDRDEPWFLLKLQEEMGELTQAYLMLRGLARTKGRTPEERDAAFRAEVADVFCHVLLLARAHDVDLPAEIGRKWLSRLEVPSRLDPPGSGAPPGPA